LVLVGAASVWVALAGLWCLIVQGAVLLVGTCSIGWDDSLFAGGLGLDKHLAILFFLPLSTQSAGKYGVLGGFKDHGT
jgi:hypothetical protein